MHGSERGGWKSIFIGRTTRYNEDNSLAIYSTQFATASMLAQYGFPHETKRSAAYILSWYKAIEDKPDLLGQAIREAMAVIRHIIKDNPLPDYSSDEGDEEALLEEVLPEAA